MKELLFSVTRDEFEWEFMPAGGPGGQAQNKKATACRCTHRASGATAVAREHRSQGQNRKAAFERVANSPEFRKWLRIETARRTGQQLLEHERGRSSDDEARIRTYHMQQKRVSDHRTGVQITDVAKVMDGGIDPFIEAMIEKAAEGRER